MTVAGKFIRVAAALILLPWPAGQVRSQQITSGPEKGWLVLHGGGTKREWSATQRFVDLAGGPNASIVVVLTAADPGTFTPDILEQYKAWWKSELGVADVSMVDTRSRQEADSEVFVAPFRKATGVWILGGHLTYLLDIYLGTHTEKEIKAVAERGGVIGGSSAGAMIQGSFLINVINSGAGAPLPKSRMFLDQTRLKGFGLLPNISIYPHLSARNAERDLWEVAKRYPEILVIGIDEFTAIVVHGDQFEVMGEGTVTVFDRAKKDYQILRRGQRFDLKKRSQIVTSSPKPTCLPRRLSATETAALQSEETSVLTGAQRPRLQTDRKEK